MEDIFGQIHIRSEFEMEQRKLLEELNDVKTELKMKRDLYNVWKEQQDDYFNLKRTMLQMAKDQDNLKKELVYYKQECFVLTKKCKELEVDLSSAKESLQKRVCGNEMKIEKLQKENAFFIDKTVPANYHKGELTRLDQKCVKEKRRHFQLEERLQQLTAEKESRQSKAITVHVHKLDKNEVVMEYWDNVKLRNKLMTTTLHLAKVKNQLQTEHAEQEKLKRCKNVKDGSKKLPSIERSNETPQYDQTIRNQHKKIQSLTGMVNMYRAEAEEYNKEKVKVAEETELNNNLNLNRKKETLVSSEALKNSKVVPSKGKSGITFLPPTLKDQPKKHIQIPAVPTKFQLGSESKSVDKRPKNIVYLQIKTTSVI